MAGVMNNRNSPFRLFSVKSVTEIHRPLYVGGGSSVIFSVVRFGNKCCPFWTGTTAAAECTNPRPDFWTDCGQPATIPRMTSKSINPYTRLGHIEVQTQDGPVRLLVKRHFDASNVSGAAYGLDWWRTPEAPKKGRLRRMLAALRRTDNT